MKKLVMTFTGASCSGKSSISKHLQRVYGHIFTEVVSHTTRPMRANEKDGYDYHYITQEQFDQMTKNGEFIENVTFNGCSYGAAIAGFEEIFLAGRVAILVCEPEGAKHIAEACKNLGYDHVAFAFEVSLATIVYRWLQRVLAEDMDNVKLAKYHSRMMESIEKEIKWPDLPMYDFVLTNENMEEFEDNVQAILTYANVYLKDGIMLGKG